MIQQPWYANVSTTAGTNAIWTLNFSSGVSYGEMNEIHLADTDQQEVEGFVIKEILRTGEWPVIPTKNGAVSRPLKIVREGASNQKDGVISLAEIVDNFEKVGLKVQVPLSDDDDDHKNITKLNTGYVRQIWLSEPDESGISKLLAKIEFTEPEVKEKVLRGTYSDVSCGIPWQIASHGKTYGTTLEHVAITNRPFIDGLGPFLAMSDKKVADATHFSTTEIVNEIAGAVDITPAIVDAQKLIESANEQIQKTLGRNFEVLHITANGFYVRNENLKTSWTIPFKVEDGKTTLSSIEEWTATEDEGEVIAPEEKISSAPHSETPAPAMPRGPEGELEAARRLREARMGTSGPFQATNKEARMPLTREELEQLNLAELPEAQRVVFQKILDENSNLAASNREKEIEQRIAELEGLGLKEKPGALKLYRQVALSDDGGPAAILLSDNGDKVPTTAQAILDQFIEAIKGAEGKVHLSDQALVSGSDIKPPETPEGEQKPLEDRLAAAKAALFPGVK